MSPKSGNEEKLKLTLASNCIAIVLRKCSAAANGSTGDAVPSSAETSSSPSKHEKSAGIVNRVQLEPQPHPAEEKQCPPGPGPPPSTSRDTVARADQQTNNGEVPERMKESQKLSESDGSGSSARCEDGLVVFREFLQENSQCYWNPSLVESVMSLEYKGSLLPITLLVSGSDYTLEVMRTAWARRVLRPPQGYDIEKLGDVAIIEMCPVTQTQFTPLSEAVCKAVYDLNAEGRLATIDFIAGRLHKCFPDMVVPDDDILCRSLGILIRERKLYHNGRGYMIPTPETYRKQSATIKSTTSSRQILMTNEEAIIRLHGNGTATSSPSSSPSHKHDGTCQSRAIQTNQKDILRGWKNSDKILVPSDDVLDSSSSPQPKLERSHSLRLLRSRDRGIIKGDVDKLNRSSSFKSSSPSKSNSTDLSSKSDPEQPDQKKEKLSMLSKLFRRHHSKGDKNASKTATKRATFSAQFPPVEWSDPHYVHFHSRGTQTIERDMFVSSKVRYGSLGRASTRDGRERHSCHLHSALVHSPRGERRSRADQRREHRMSAMVSKSASLPRRSFAGPETATEVVTRRGKSSPKLRRHRFSDSLPSSGREYAKKPEQRHSTRSEKLNNIEFFKQEVEAMKQLNITANELQKGGMTITDALPPSGSYPTRLSAPLMSPYMDETTLRNLRSPPLRESVDKTKLLNSGPIISGVPTGILGSNRAGYNTPVKMTPMAKPQNVIPDSNGINPQIVQKPELDQPQKIQCNNSLESIDQKKQATTHQFSDLTVGSSIDVAIEINPTAEKDKPTVILSSSDPFKTGLSSHKMSTSSSKPAANSGQVWSHTVSTKTTHSGQYQKSLQSSPSVTTATTVTTSLSHGALKSVTSTTCSSEKQKSRSTSSSPVHDTEPILELKSKVNDIAEKIEFITDPDAPLSPIRKKMADAKAAFFANGAEKMIDREQLFFPTAVGGSK